MRTLGSFTRRQSASVSAGGHRAGLALLVALIGLSACDVYNQTLIESAVGDAGIRAGGGTAGASVEGGTGGGSGGNGGRAAGGTSGAQGGTAGTAGATAGTGGDAGDDDPGSGGSSAQGGDSMGGAGGSGGTAQGGTTGGAGDSGSAGAAGGLAGDGGGGAGTGGAGAGMGGAGAGMGGAGAGGAGAGGAGTGGAEVCGGCARLSVPLAAVGDQAHFTLTLPAATDFSAATIAFRVARYEGSGGWFKAYIQEGSPDFAYQGSTETAIADIGTSFETITWDIATAGTNADKTIIRRVGIEISGGDATSWTNPTIIHVDSIVITDTNLALSSFTFDTASTVSTTPTTSGPSNVIWLNNSSSDTNVTGAAVSWLGP